MPRVSVVTPFYNTADYLAECIEGVLSQTLEDFEYLLVDNASTDDSLEIARRYAQGDSRIRLVHYDEHLPQIVNYNRALRLADPKARYCKMAQADDVLLSRCLELMVELADSDEAIGLVGAYTILQDQVFLDGLDFYEKVIEGEELARRYFHDGPYILGSPTSLLYRMSDVQAQEAFFPEGSVVADADVAMRLILGRRFGFVHQVLSFVRRDEESISARRDSFNIDALTRRVLLEKYGRQALDEETFRRRRGTLRRRHDRVLGEGALVRAGADFWTFHRAGLADAGLSISPWRVVMGLLVVLLRYPLNAESTLRRLWNWVRGGAPRT